VLAVGSHPLSGEFIPSSGNYTRAIETVMLTVLEAPAGGLNFTGFFRPVHNLPFVNRVTAGRAIPVKFSVEGYRRASSALSGPPTSVQVACNDNLSERLVEGSITGGVSHLKVVGRSHTYTWKTSSAWAGTCRKLVVTLVDGSRHEALFRFVKPSVDKGKKNRWNRRPRSVGR
jgi:hypothetical protein